MIFVEKLIPGSKSIIEPLFPEPMVSNFYTFCFCRTILSILWRNVSFSPFKGFIVNFSCNPDRPELMAVLRPDSIELWKIFPAPLLLTSIRRIPEFPHRSSRLTAISFVPRSKVTCDSLYLIWIWSFHQFCFNAGPIGRWWRRKDYRLLTQLFLKLMSTVYYNYLIVKSAKSSQINITSIINRHCNKPAEQ